MWIEEEKEELEKGGHRNAFVNFHLPTTALTARREETRNEEKKREFWAMMALSKDAGLPILKMFPNSHIHNTHTHTPNPPLHRQSDGGKKERRYG